MYCFLHRWEESCCYHPITFYLSRYRPSLFQNFLWAAPQIHLPVILMLRLPLLFSFETCFRLFVLPVPWCCPLSCLLHAAASRRTTFFWWITPVLVYTRTRPPYRSAHMRGIKWGAHDCNRVALLLSENAQLLTFLDEPRCIFGRCCFASFILWMVSIYTRAYSSRDYLSFMIGKEVPGNWLRILSQSRIYTGFAYFSSPH